MDGLYRRPLDDPQMVRVQKVKFFVIPQILIPIQLILSNYFAVIFDGNPDF